MMRMRPVLGLLRPTILVLLMTVPVESFAPFHQKSASNTLLPHASLHRAQARLCLFKRKEEQDDKSDSEGDKSVPFFSRLLKRTESQEDEQASTEDVSFVATATVDPPRSSKKDTDRSKPIRLASLFRQKEEEPKELTPVEKAQLLKNQAAKTRLEAEKMDAELTLAKIARLEKQVAAAQRKGESTEDLMREVGLLQQKMITLSQESSGQTKEPSTPTTTAANSPSVSSEEEQTPSSEATDPNVSFAEGESEAGARVLDRSLRETTDESESATVAMESALVETTTAAAVPKSDSAGSASSGNPAFDQKVFDEALREFTDMPDFIKIVQTRAVGMDAYDVKEMNATEYALRVEQMARLDYSFLEAVPPPTITAEEITNHKNSIEFKLRKQFQLQENALKELSDDELARKLLEAKYYREYLSAYMANISDEGAEQVFETLGGGNADASDGWLEGAFPACISKDDQTPTEVQAKLLASEILPKAGFEPSGAPNKVFGGYLISGTSRKENGNDLVDAIDLVMAKSPVLKDKLTVVYMKDLSYMQDASALFELPNAIYVLGPNVAREPRRLQLTLVSALGLATTWYLSIYPFLLNPSLMKRAEEQLSLADSSMQYDLSWLTELSFPLFTTFIGLQLFHELGHRVVAGIYNVSAARDELDVATLVC